MEDIPHGYHGNQITPLLPLNKNLTLARLQSTTRKLGRIQKLEEYHTVMEQQLEHGTLELLPEPATELAIHYIPHHPDRNIISYRFTHVIFGSAPSPYILGSTLQKHIGQYAEKYPETVADLLNNTYVDDFHSGGGDIEKLSKFKAEATEIMKEGAFRLHKWHCNMPKIEKSEDNVLGIVAPVVIVEKILYSQVCLKDLKWDEKVPEEIQRTWDKWLKAICKQPLVSVPRSVVDNRVMRLVLHGFSDASDLAVCSVIFVVAYHEALPVKQNLLVGKSRIAPRNTSIPRKELVVAHMLSQLMNHAKQTLENQPINEYHCWVDSTTILYWIKGQGTWSIQEKNYLQWHYVPTSENPSDQGSRGV
ncbi:uncharacterized protein [Montipora capricornis]|uniref:uncharacterized protein n=1 Tax=Montipora capricornis TaxID=246305 RepID=UPI0035F11DD5